MLRVIICLIIAISLLSPLQAKKKKKKKDISKDGFGQFTGEVSVTSAKATKIFRVGDITVGRGSVRHISSHVGKKVSLNCKIVKDKIITIKSMKVLGDAQKDKTKGVIGIAELERWYHDAPSKTINLYRTKPLKFSGKVTDIKNHSSDQYKITLNKGKGKIVILKAKLSKDITHKLWAGKKPTVSFTGKWTTNETSSFIFKEISAIKFK